VGIFGQRCAGVRRSISTLGCFLMTMHEAIQRPSRLQAKSGGVITSGTISGILRTSHRLTVARPSQSFVAVSPRSLALTNVRAQVCQATLTGLAKYLPIVPARKVVYWSAHCKTIVAFAEHGHSSQTQHPNRSFERTHTGGGRVQVFLGQRTPVCAAQFRR